MKNRKGRILSIFLVLVMLVGMLPLSVFATDVENQDIIGLGTRSQNKYLVYMAKQSPIEHELRFQKLDATNYWLEMQDNQGTLQRYIAFCFNETKTSPNGNKYKKKFDAATEKEFRELATKPIDEGFRNSVLWAVYLGYPGHKGHLGQEAFVDRAVNFYNIPRDCAEDAVRLATQMAIWLFTDRDTALHNFWSPIVGNALGNGDIKKIKICEKYTDRQTMGDPITYLAADIAAQAYAKKGNLPKDMELDLYIPNQEEYRDKKQNLLVTHYTEKQEPQYGQLKIVKEVQGAHADFDKKFTFVVTLKDNADKPINGKFGNYDFNNGTAEISVSAKEPVILDKIPVGTTYTVTEKDDADYTRISKNNDTGTIQDKQTAEATFVNEIKQKQRYGELKISKTIHANNDEHNADQFTFTVKLDNPNADVSQVAGAKFIDGEAKVVVTANQDITITGLPEGVGYTVTEQPYEEWAMTSKNATGHIIADQAMEASFVNTYLHTGQLVIQKIINGTRASDDDEFHFRVTLYAEDGTPLSDTHCNIIDEGGVTKSVPITNGELDLSIVGNGFVSITDLPTNAEYWVEERQADGSYVSTVGNATEHGYTLTDVTGNTHKTIADERMKVVFTNSKEEEHGNLKIFKATEGSKTSTDDTFYFRITLKDANGNPLSGTYQDQEGQDITFDASGVAVVTSKGGSGNFIPFVAIKDLPAGTKYTVEERTDTVEEYTSELGTVVKDGYILKNIKGDAVGTIGTGKNNVTFVNQKVDTALTIRKTIANDIPTKDTFTFEITLEGEGAKLNGVIDGVSFQNGHATITIQGADEKVITGLPECTFTVAEKPIEGWKIPENKTGTLQDGSQETVVFENVQFRQIPDTPDASTSEKKSVTVKKEWKLDDNGQATSSVTVALLKDGVEQKTVVLNAENDWTHTWNNLSKDGAWTVVEKDVPEGFTSSVTQDASTFIITNDDMPKTPETTSVTVKKEWKLNDNGQATSSVTVALLKDGVEQKTVVLNAGNNWTHTWDNLSKDGAWTVVEKDVPEGFTSSVTQDASTFIITNDDMPQKPNQSHQSTSGKKPTISVTAKKEWKLDDDGQATSSVTVALLKDGMEQKTAELNAENNWTYTWENLSKDGNWSVVEKNVPDGFSSFVEQDGLTFIVTNDDMPDGSQYHMVREEGTHTENNHDVSTTSEKVEHTNHVDVLRTPEKMHKPNNVNVPKISEKMQKPSTPKEVQDSGNLDAVPQTSDHSHVAMWAMVSLALLSGGVYLLLCRKKHPNA